MARILEKERAIKLRGRGFGISEIAKKLSIGKSTVSYWCREIPLSTTHLRRLKRKQQNASIRGLILAAEKKRLQRIEQTKICNTKGRADTGKLSKRDLFILGLALYWGEGYKKGNEELGFTNSDPNINKIFIRWLEEIYGITREKLILRVSINHIHRSRIAEVTRFWSKKTQVPIEQFTKPSFIKTTIKKEYSNKAEHFGTLRIKVRNGANLRRRILGSIEKMSEYS